MALHAAVATPVRLSLGNAAFTPSLRKSMDKAAGGRPVAHAIQPFRPPRRSGGAQEKGPDQARRSNGTAPGTRRKWQSGKWEARHAPTRLGAEAVGAKLLRGAVHGQGHAALLSADPAPPAALPPPTPAWPRGACYGSCAAITPLAEPAGTGSFGQGKRHYAAVTVLLLKIKRK